MPAKWSNAVQTLTGRIVELAGASKSAFLNVTNLSSLNAAEVSGVARALETELGQRLQLVTGPTAETEVTVTLSEDIAEYVWVAQVRNGTSEQTAIVAIPREAKTEFRGEQPAVSLEQKPVWAQQAAFLDFALPNTPPGGVPQMIVLETNRIVSYESRAGQWMPAASIVLHPAATPPRDVRGMIWQSAGNLEVFLPGESCSGTPDSILSLSCAPFPSTNPEMNWPVVAPGSQRANATFRADRNFFDALGASGETSDGRRPAFYTAAAIGTPDHTSWVLAQLDGKAHLYAGPANASATFSGWGDGIAAIQSGCSVSAEVLATGTGDWTQPDHIQMYEIGERQALAAGQPLDFPGPILAIWSSTDLKSARVVSRNLQTGMYEASIVTVSCGD
jgi:hypothetical protein